MDFAIPPEILPLQHADDNKRFSDHRREWTKLLREMRRRAVARHRHYRRWLPES